VRSFKKRNKKDKNARVMRAYLICSSGISHNLIGGYVSPPFLFTINQTNNLKPIYYEKIAISFSH